MSDTSEMEIGPATVVAFRYDLYDEHAERIETNATAEPVAFLFGTSGVLAALQDAFRGKCAGDDFSITIPHDKAYGRRYPSRVRRVSKKSVEGGKGEGAKGRTFRVGERVTLREADRPIHATVVKVGRFQLDIDSNHPLAGHDLTFDVKIESVRAATDEEIAHGHAHGPGGHHH